MTFDFLHKLTMIMVQKVKEGEVLSIQACGCYKIALFPHIIQISQPKLDKYLLPVIKMLR